MRKWHLIVTAFVALALTHVAATGAVAEVRLSGHAEKLVLEARDASLPEIASALGSALNVEIALTGSTTRRFTGVYAGSIRGVLSRLLAATDHVVEPAGDRLRVRIVGIETARQTAAHTLAADEAAKMAALAAASAGPAGARASRIRQQRIFIEPVSARD